MFSGTSVPSRDVANSRTTSVSLNDTGLVSARRVSAAVPFFSSYRAKRGGRR